MTDLTFSPSPSFSELSIEAKTLLFIYASAAWALRHPNIPDSTMLLTELENFWCAQQLSADVVSDPHRMTLLLEKHLDSLSPDIDANTCREEHDQSCRGCLDEQDSKQLLSGGTSSAG